MNAAHRAAILVLAHEARTTARDACAESRSIKERLLRRRSERLAGHVEARLELQDRQAMRLADRATADAT